MRVVLIASLVLVIGLALFYHFGRSVWHPVKVKVSGKRTTEEVVDQLRDKMIQRWDNMHMRYAEPGPTAILAFKEERIVELWKHLGPGWHLVDTYPLTGYSGQLGPKLKEGDLQIPEGVYQLEYLNPNSSYHLSFKIDYPNTFDRAKAEAEGRTGLGGDIFFHGSSVTVGCIPLGDENIEQLFYWVATSGYQNTRVIIAPYDMRKGMRELEIESVTWETELYTRVAEALAPFSP